MSLIISLMSGTFRRPAGLGGEGEHDPPINLLIYNRAVGMRP